MDRQNLLKYIVDEIGPQMDDRKAILYAQCLYDGGLPKPDGGGGHWFSGRWVTGRWGVALGVSSAFQALGQARGIKRAIYAL